MRASAEVIARILAVVNRQIITLSDLEREQKFQATDRGDLPAIQNSSEAKGKLNLIDQRRLSKSYQRQFSNSEVIFLQKIESRWLSDSGEEKPSQVGTENDAAQRGRSSGM
jgi:hypothetical protein